jgi:hypothetical protein
VKELQEFLRLHAGMEIPLELIAGDHRSHAKGGLIRVAGMLSLDQRVDTLFTQVQRGEEPMSVRLDFAWGLHAAERYSEALQIVEDILAKVPGCREALLHKSHIHCDQGEFAKSAAAARLVLAAEPSDIDGLDCLAHASEGLKDWRAVAELCTRILELSAGESKGFRRRFLSQRARSRMQLGDFAAATADIAEIRSGGRELDGHSADHLEQLMAELRARSFVQAEADL